MKAATLAVGTEVVDGQITDRNSAWISAKLVAAGVEVIEHRAVADDRAAIAKALKELTSQVDLLFVTGGLGPTSDDFTREIISEAFSAPLAFDDAAWTHIETRFQARGLQAKPIQRQQCFFPQGAEILDNPAGTAHAFWLSVPSAVVIALPGPPLEIAAVWDKHLAAKIEALIPEADREDLILWRMLGVGESEVAERVEAILQGTGLRIGYRAHLPYVEVKLWIKRRERDSRETKEIVAKIENALAQWLVAKGKADLADAVLKAADVSRVIIQDSATGGLLQSRLFERVRETKAQGSLVIESEMTDAAQGGPFERNSDGSALRIRITSDLKRQVWLLSVKKSAEVLLELEVAPTPLYSFGTERGRRYLTERVFHALQKISP